MGRRKDFIPLKDSEFYSFQRILVTKVQVKKADWEIPDAALNVLVGHRVIYEPLYQKVALKNTRTSVDVMAHRRERKAYEKAIRAFINAYIRFNGRMINTDRLTIGVSPPDKKPSPKPKINEIPFVGMDPIGGGWIKVTCRRMTDKDRPSMHKYADVIECRYALLPVRPQPVEGKKFRFPTPDECPNVYISTKANFIIKCGVENAGLQFYGYFRWANLSNPANSGQWNNGKTVIVT
jgi:hypothetical protein